MKSFKSFLSSLVPEFIRNKNNLLLLVIDDIKKSNKTVNNWLEENDPSIIRKCTKYNEVVFPKAYFLYLFYLFNTIIMQVMIKEEYIHIYEEYANFSLFLSVIGFIICVICHVIIFVHFLHNIKYYYNIQIPDANPISTPVFYVKSILLTKKLLIIVLFIAAFVGILIGINELVVNYTVGGKPFAKKFKADIEAIKAILHIADSGVNK